MVVHMKKIKMCGVAGTFAVFQGLMPMIGWGCIHTIVQCFKAFEELVPWISLALLGFIGGKMLWEGIKGETEEAKNAEVGLVLIIIQGIATSIDALSVGFTIAEYDFVMAFICALIIAVVTFFICMFGLCLGKKFGMKFSDRATAFGGMILILIGIEIFVTGIVF